MGPALGTLRNGATIMDWGADQWGLEIMTRAANSDKSFGVSISKCAKTACGGSVRCAQCPSAVCSVLLMTSGSPMMALSVRHMAPGSHPFWTGSLLH